jgi:hypothetical protein
MLMRRDLVAVGVLVVTAVILGTTVLSGILTPQTAPPPPSALPPPSPPGGSPPPRQDVPADPKLALSADLDQRVYRAGDSATVRVILTNVGKFRAVLDFPVPCMGEFLVSNASLGDVFNSSKWWGCIQILWTLPLDPGASYAWSFSWNLTDDHQQPLPVNRSYVVTPEFVWRMLPYQGYVIRTDTASFYLAT